MTLRTGLRNLITRKKADAEIELTAPPAAVAPKPPAVAVAAPAREAPRPEAAARPAGDDRVTKLLARIDERLGAQVTELQRLGAQVAGLPRNGPDAAAANARFDELRGLLAEHQESARKRDEAIASLGRTGEVLARQDKALELIGAKLDSNARALRGALETVATISGGLDEAVQACTRTQEVVAQTDRAGADRELRLTETLARWQRKTALLIFACGAISLVAIVIAVAALLS